MLDTLIVLAIVGWAVFYLVRRYRRMWRPQAEDPCACGCSGCGQAAGCGSDGPSARPMPDSRE